MLPVLLSKCFGAPASSHILGYKNRGKCCPFFSSLFLDPQRLLTFWVIKQGEMLPVFLTKCFGVPASSHVLDLKHGEMLPVLLTKCFGAPASSHALGYNTGDNAARFSHNFLDPQRLLTFWVIKQGKMLPVFLTKLFGAAASSHTLGFRTGGNAARFSHKMFWSPSVFSHFGF